MTKHVTALFLFGFLSLQINAQIIFEKGYFITNSGERTDCLIKNVDWRNNPDSFEYKIKANGEIKVGTIDGHVEFAFENGTKYVGREVRINRSTDKTDRLEADRTISFQKEKLFLRVLVEGPAKLYYYEEGDLRRFFFAKDDGEITQLRYKRFRKDPDNDKFRSGEHRISENNEFRQQLLNQVRCPSQNTSLLKKLPYKIDPLVKYFADYNQCLDPNYVIKEQGKTPFNLNIAIRPGLNSTSLEVDNSFSAFRTVNFAQKAGLRLGMEFEAVLPFNKGKWAILAEPTYHSYSDEAETIPRSMFSLNTVIATIDYKSLEVPVGLRHYIFISKKSKLFMNVSLLLDIPFNSNIVYRNGVSETIAELGFNTGVTAGIGYNFNDSFSIEGRFLGSREVFSASEFISYISDYKGFSFILGYTIF